MKKKIKISKQKINKIVFIMLFVYMIAMALICVFKYHRYDAANTFLLVLVLLELELK